MKALSGGQGGVVGVIGEAGLGKSRLITELHRNLTDIQWLEGKTLSFGQTISYWPFQEILRTYVGIDEDDSELQAWVKLESKIVTLFPDTALDILPYLATLLVVEVQDEYVERVKYLDGDALGKRVFLAMRRFLDKLARVQPLVLVFEDMHWMDASSAELLEHLLPLVREVPLLLIGVSRADPESAGGRLRQLCAEKYADCYTEVRLAPLSPGESTQLVNNLVAIDNMPAQVRETMMRKAEGNPFFLEEIIRSLLDVGAIMRDPATGRWRATAQINTVHIPNTVQGVIMARIDRLDEAVKQALCVAAVIGRSFLYRILREVDTADEALDAHLGHLQQVELIRAKESAPELEYIFKHALAQEATYESILFQKRRELHGRVAAAVEALFAERLDEFYSLLAYHYARAENWEKAQDYLFKSGDQAGRMAANTEALAHYQQAMEAYSRAFGDQWDPVQRAQFERKMGEVLFRRGEHQQALVYLYQALSYLGRPLPTSNWGVLVSILREGIRQITHRLFPRWYVKPDNSQVAPAVMEEYLAYVVIGWIDLLTNPKRCLSLVLKILNLSESNGYLQGIAAGSSGTGTICDFIYAYSIADHYHSRALSLAIKIEDPFALSQSYASFAAHYGFLGEWDRAMHYSELAADIYREIGDLHKWSLTINWKFLALTYQGALSQALSLCQNMVHLAQEVGDSQMHCWGLAGQGFVQWRLGQFDDAIAALQQAAEFARALPDTAFNISTTADLGRCYLRQGKLAEALTALETSQKAFVPNLGGDSYASLRNGLAEVYLTAAEQSGGSERADWLKKAGRACQEALRQDKEFRPGLPEALRLRGTYEWLQDKHSAAQQWWQRSLSLAEQMGQHYDIGRLHLEVGQRLGEVEHIRIAEAIFAKVGAKPDLESAQAALAPK